MKIRCCLVAAALFLVSALHATTVSPLLSRGYTVLPEPQQVNFTGDDFRFSGAWRLQVGPGVAPNDVAVESLTDLLRSRAQMALASNGNGVIELALSPNSVNVGAAIDQNKQVIAEQAYELDISPAHIRIGANAPAGLFYGVQTLGQLLTQRNGESWLPQARIVDWPDLELRVIYWDDAHHLDHIGVLEKAIRDAAFFKINGFSIKLEGHFQYASAPAIVEPYALSPSELQHLTDYGLRYHVQLIPYLDGPAHIAFILKHPEYARLREFPDSNYELCVTNPDSYKLMFGMYADLLAANRGVKYFNLSTDEPYYVGLAKNSQCDEVDRAHELGTVGKLLDEFVRKTAGYLHDHGRVPIFWGEYPLVPGDIPSLPPYLINGETYGPDFDRVFRQQGIREMFYVSTEGVEPLFPDYYILPTSERVRAGSAASPRVDEMVDLISRGTGRRDGNMMGMFDAGWADTGLHPETFWLGYATGAAAGWHPVTGGTQPLMNAFYALFYGPGAVNVGRLYQLMSEQAQFWDTSWDNVPSTARKRIWGSSYRIGAFPATDQSLPLPPLPSANDLSLAAGWQQANARRLELADKELIRNSELLDLLNENLHKTTFNQYNLEVFLAIANLCRQNLQMIHDLGRIYRGFESAQDANAHNQPAQAVAALDRALDIAENIREQRNAALRDATETWYKSWFPRVAEANGRHFLHILDDVKDHPPDRTVDMSYLVYRELLLPFGNWVERVQAVRNQYASAHRLTVRTTPFNWQDINELPREARVFDEED